MIVRERPSALRLFLVVRGSVLPRIRTTLIVNTLIATLVTWCHGTLFDHKVILTTIPFTLIGLPLAIFLGFRAFATRPPTTATGKRASCGANWCCVAVISRASARP